jgi:hypothetical protein
MKLGMKKINITSKIFIFIILLQLIACTKGFEQINTNPNAEPKGSSSGELLGAEIEASQDLMDNAGKNFNGGMTQWVEYYTTRLNRAFFIPPNPESDWNDFWIYQSLVTSVLPLLNRVISNANDIRSPNYKAVALVMKSMVYFRMSNLWGALPFTDAQHEKAFNNPKYTHPKFDTQETIYKGVLNWLEQADSLFSDTAPPLNAKADAYGQGKIEKWKRYDNSLQAKILLDMSGPDLSFAKKGLERIFLNPNKYPIINSTKYNFGMNWETQPHQAYTDPFLETLNSGAAFTAAASSGIVNLLGRLKDPRMKVYFDPAPAFKDTTYVGAPVAFDNSDTSNFKHVVQDSLSHISEKFSTQKLRPLITHSQLLFIRAEAALMNINVGISAQQAYEQGIKTNMEFWGIDNTKIQKYLNQSKVKFSTNSKKALLQIVTQRYISQFGQSTTTFALIRRTGGPGLDYFNIGIEGRGYPQRVSYVMEMMPEFNKTQFAKVSSGILDALWGKPLWFAKEAPSVRVVPDHIQTGYVTWSY